MALSSDDLPELPKPANATLGFCANLFCTCATISSMASSGTGLRTISSIEARPGALVRFLMVPQPVEGKTHRFFRRRAHGSVRRLRGDHEGGRNAGGRHRAAG